MDDQKTMKDDEGRWRTIFFYIAWVISGEGVISDLRCYWKSAQNAGGVLGEKVALSDVKENADGP